jgi:hypothetical protein
MNSIPAKAMLLAIGLQESRFEDRTQMEGGPARGFWQFERGGGVFGVLGHPATKARIASVLQTMGYNLKTATSHEAIEHNDILACVFARLLLWTHPDPLPVRGDVSGSWSYYTSCWRPGKPHREMWDAHYNRAWKLAQGD